MKKYRRTYDAVVMNVVTKETEEMANYSFDDIRINNGDIIYKEYQNIWCGWISKKDFHKKYKVAQKNEPIKKGCKLISIKPQYYYIIGEVTKENLCFAKLLFRKKDRRNVKKGMFLVNNIDQNSFIRCINKADFEKEFIEV